MRYYEVREGRGAVSRTYTDTAPHSVHPSEWDAMVHGTTLAIRLGDIMVEKATNYKAPADLVADIRELSDRLIVLAMRSGNSRAEKQEVGEALIAAIETYTVAIGVAWTSTMQAMEGLTHGEG